LGGFKYGGGKYFIAVKWVFGFSTRFGFYVVWDSGYFLAKCDKIWVSEALHFFAAFYYQFTDDTKFNGTETAVVMIFILLLFHLFHTTSAFSLWHCNPADNA